MSLEEQQKQIQIEQRVRQEARAAGKKDSKDRTVRENPHPPGALADVWHSAYQRARRGW